MKNEYDQNDVFILILFLAILVIVLKNGDFLGVLCELLDMHDKFFLGQ